MCHRQPVGSPNWRPAMGDSGIQQICLGLCSYTDCSGTLGRPCHPSSFLCNLSCSTLRGSGGLCEVTSLRDPRRSGGKETQFCSLASLTSLTLCRRGWSQSLFTSQWLSRNVRVVPWAASAPRIRDRTRPASGTNDQVGATVPPSPGHPNTHPRPPSPASQHRPTLPLSVA